MSSSINQDNIYIIHILQKFRKPLVIIITGYNLSDRTRNKEPNAQMFTHRKWSVCQRKMQCPKQILENVKQRWARLQKIESRTTLKSNSVNLYHLPTWKMLSHFRKLFVLLSYLALIRERYVQKCTLQILASCRLIEGGPKAILQFCLLSKTTSPQGALVFTLTGSGQKVLGSPESLAPRPLLQFLGLGIHEVPL